MKKLLMGLTAIVATSFAVPAFADDAKPADAPKEAKKGKKGKKAKGEAKKAEGEAKPAEAAPAK